MLLNSVAGESVRVGRGITFGGEPIKIPVLCSVESKLGVNNV